MDRVADAVVGLPQSDGRVVRRLVVLRDEVPHAVLDENVRRHVARVRDRRRYLGVAVDRVECQRGMERIVEGVNGVVHRSGMVAVLVEHLHRDRASPHLKPQRLIAECTGSGQHRERVGRRHLVVIGVALVEPLHRLHVADPPLVVGSLVAPQDLDRFEEAPLAIGRGLGGRAAGVGPSRASTVRGFSSSRADPPPNSGWL